MEQRIQLIQGDLTDITADVLVNAANNHLHSGGGVDAAIHRKGGPAILEECQMWVGEHGELPTGKCIVTSAGDLTAKFVIHTVGPIWFGGKSGEDLLLTNAYVNSLKLATEKGAKTIAFPNISTGVFGYPKEKAAKIAIAAITGFLEKDRNFEKVIFVCYDEENYNIYKQLLPV
jgi:O-acetyl-ADP-ribose deacetylase (regulator of RNase III)